jgi:hypothetical protein
MLDEFSAALLSRADHATVAIDWCEANFAMHPSIAELYNTLSSFSFCLTGLSIALQCLYLPRLRTPLYFSGPLIFLLGLASAAFHATLSLTWQRIDEMTENISLVALLHGALQPTWGLLSYLIHSALATLGVLRIHDFLFTELHLIGSAVALGVALHTLSVHASSPPGRPLPPGIRGRLLVVCASALLGGVAWVIDRLACQHIPSQFNFQLHAWWHVGGAIALHEAFVVAAYAGTTLDGGKVSLQVGPLGLVSIVVPGGGGDRVGKSM